MALNKIDIRNDQFIPKNFNQSRITRLFTQDKIEDFNDRFFIESDKEVIKEIEKVILSWQRTQGFRLEVMNFTVVEDPEEINEIIYNNEVSRSKSGKADPSLDCIDLKDSYTILLIVTYLIEVYNTDGINKDKKTKDVMTELILIPRIVNQYYYYMKGNYYHATLQIVDGSTYNNSDKVKRKTDVIAFKTGRPIRINHYIYTLTTVDDIEIKYTVYNASITNRHGPAMRYIFAKMGLLDGLAFMGLEQYIVIHDSIPEHDDNFYVIKCPNDTYIKVGRYIFDNSQIVQSAVGTILIDVVSTTTYNEMFTIEYWLGTLSKNAKGIINMDTSITLLTNLEQYYDIGSRELLRLPEKDKATIYNIIFWMMKEFSTLRSRDNTDMYYKRIQRSRYIASLYAGKLSSSLVDLTNMKRNNLTVDTIKKRIYTNPYYLIKIMAVDTLISINNRVNDDDAFSALKASYKGIGGIGENSKKAISDKYKNVYYSEAGIKDMTHSSASDPGMTTLLCPLGVLADDNYFYDYKEPNNWEESFDLTIKNFNDILNMTNAITFNKDIDTHRNYYLEKHYKIESLEIMKRLIEPFREVDRIPAIVMHEETPLEEGGLIVYEHN